MRGQYEAVCASPELRSTNEIKLVGRLPLLLAEARLHTIVSTALRRALARIAEFDSPDGNTNNSDEPKHSPTNMPNLETMPATGRAKFTPKKCRARFAD